MNGARLISAERDSFIDLAIADDGLELPAGSCRPWLSRQTTGSTIVQFKCLPSCRNREFPTSADFESKLSVMALMWSANSGTPRSWCIYLLITYQGAKIVRRRHLDCNACSLRTWVQVADLHAGYAWSIVGKMSFLYSRTPFLTDRSLPIQEGTQHAHPFSSPLPGLIDVRRPGE